MSAREAQLTKQRNQMRHIRRIYVGLGLNTNGRERKQRWPNAVTHYDLHGLGKREYQRRYMQWWRAQ